MALTTMLLRRSGGLASPVAGCAFTTRSQCAILAALCRTSRGPVADEPARTSVPLFRCPSGAFRLMELAWLGDRRAHDAAQVGGKAASLSRLAAEYRVPP